MRPPRSFSRSFAVPAVLVAAVFVGSCTKNSPPPSQTSTGASTPASTTPTIQAKPGEYTYENAGVIATVQYQPDKSMLTVTNHTGAEIPAPGIYMLDARDGHRIAGTVENATPIPSATSKDFTVTFASQTDENNVGLMILLIGHANYGAFVPPTTH